MKNYLRYLCIALTGIVSAIFLTGCGEKEKSRSELVLGNWSQERNRAYVLLYISLKGEWTSSVKISEATSKVVKSKGNAKGIWNIEKDQIIFTVMESDIEDVWEKNRTLLYNIVDLTESRMQFQDENGAMTVWTRTRIEKSAEGGADPAIILPLAPVVVNLNKNRSNDKDRYLCLKMNMIFKEPMPGQKLPPLHPKVLDSAIIFFSSLVYEDIKDFDGVKDQCRNLVRILNPYMEDMIKELVVENVILASDIDRVEEFIIEHTPPPPPAPGEEKGARMGKRRKKKNQRTKKPSPWIESPSERLPGP
nr:flagellar basal body-associated FliL family protein [Desulfobacula sp.]